MFQWTARKANRRLMLAPLCQFLARQKLFRSLRYPEKLGTAPFSGQPHSVFEGFVFLSRGWNYCPVCLPLNMGGTG
ncbi:MAG: hypothetical protein DFNUSKGM_003185 [Candidatus Fervidibacter sacchari]